MLVYHPINEKNRKLRDAYEEFTRIEGAKDESLIIARMNGLNESEYFKGPEKLPAVLYFKSRGDGLGKEIVPLENINQLLVKSASEDKVHERLREFIHACR